MPLETLPVASAMPWDVLLRLTWPAAVASIAFSPLGRGLAAYLQGRGGASSSTDRLASAMDRLAEAQEEQSKVLQQMQLALGILLDRPRGG